MEENRIKIWIHKIKDTAVVLLHFLAVCSPLSLVCVTTPELLAGETIGQWVWFGKAVLFSTGCIVVVCLLQLFYGSSRKEMLSFSSFSACVSWSLILLGGIEAVWGLCQLYGFSASGHFRYALTGSFFNPGPYAGYLAMVLPVCLHHYMQFGASGGGSSGSTDSLRITGYNEPFGLGGCRDRLCMGDIHASG